MKKILLVPALLMLAFTTFAQQAEHVILITIDGFRPDFYQDASWGMVNLRMMKDSGAYADGVNSVFPTVTYPNHTSLITGVTPMKHGIYYNTPYEPKGATGVWYFYYDSLKVPTLFDAVHKAGKKSASVIWPVTVHAPVDYNIPDVWPLDKNKDRRVAMAEYGNPSTLWQEVQDSATGKIQEDDWAMNNGELIFDENIARISGYLIQKYKPAFITLHFPCTDHYEHQIGRDGYLVRKSVSGADRAIGTILEAVKRAGIADNTTIIVTGDHGFVNIEKSFNPNVLLVKNAIKAQFHACGGSAFLHLEDKNDEATVDKVIAILKALPADQQKMFRILDRQQLDKIGADPNAAMAITALGHVTIGSSKKGEFIKPAKGGTHGYYPDFKEIQTGFVAYGAGIKQGGHVKEMNVTDVAPIIAELLKLDLGKVDGKVPAGVIK
ncbi:MULTISPECIES: alkaline phosphatase family protein [unclassified Chitinophaga]|uniref:alkaline phosphatase family protein n=1 Tax=unclassified Chitinophaga TaxID=2619133 RepID=UPI0009C90D20|nr:MULTISPECIES: ectonucleotide pyrophosphatase/phosphodiesterase [unclassified Chitinophaga]OMP76065.1 AP endonuclease [[Flexibacter] sp. ATCC 35208]WPV69348.1 ectonucleotide pyrophosphatase/phosphodiesterase [Chitinophaga sp. LS1]